MKKMTTLIFACFLLLSCHKDDDPLPTCGCDSPTTNSVTNTTGVLKKNFGNFANTSISSSYYIVTGSGNMNSYLSVCNVDFLNSITIAENTNVTVVFSGDIKTMCNPPFTVGFTSFTNIKLTKIQKQ